MYKSNKSNMGLTLTDLGKASATSIFPTNKTPKQFE